MSQGSTDLFREEPLENENSTPLQNQNSQEIEEQIGKHSYRHSRNLLDDFIKDLNQHSDPEQKLKFTIDFMESSLSQNGNGNFKNFWEARKSSLECFKDENISSTVRFHLWNKFTQLSQEAYRLKEVLDEQSQFATEQIELAVLALEHELQLIDQKNHLGQSFDFSFTAKSLGNRLPEYQKIQSELQLLNAYAARINSMRKELIKTNMRIRQKNGFFQRLSLLGDKVFPRRKELIQEVSQLFMNDIDLFIKTNFQDGSFGRQLFFLRDEIKSLQNMAKILTLNTSTFTHTRLSLSECWDKIKKEEKERKKQHAEQKAHSKQHVEQVREKIKVYSDSLATLSSVEGETKLKELFSFLKSQPLNREDFTTLKEEIYQVGQRLREREREEQKDRENQQQERENKKREKFTTLKRKMEKSLDECSEIEGLQASLEGFSVEMQSTTLSRAEKQELERLMRIFREKITEKKDLALLSLPAEERLNIENLTTLLVERKARRQEIKKQLESYRKASGTSGLGFEQSMKMNEFIQNEKERLEKINESIDELEEKLAELEGEE